MKFSDLPVAGGTRAHKPMTIALPNVEQPVAVLVRPTSALEDCDATRFALEYAKKGGVTSPAPGDPLYDSALWAAVVAIAYLQPDEGHQAFFDGGRDQVMKSLPTETVAYLYQQQQRWQEEISPSFKARSVAELAEAVHRIASDDGDVFFSACSPYTQIALARFMAALLKSSPATSSLGGAHSVESTESSSPKPRRARHKTPLTKVPPTADSQSLTPKN